jgi:hypothetical protein
MLPAAFGELLVDGLSFVVVSCNTLCRGKQLAVSSFGFLFQLRGVDYQRNQFPRK